MLQFRINILLIYVILHIFKRMRIYMLVNGFYLDEQICVFSYGVLAYHG